MRACQPIRDGYVERDGIKIFYEVFGAGEPTVLLLPTWSIIHSRQWKMQIPYLARHCRVITFDGRGNGRSDRPTEAEAYTESEFAADAIAIMSNAIIKQQGDSPIVADNIWEFRLGGGSFVLGALAGALVTAVVGRRIAKDDAAPKPPTPRGWPINFAHRGGAKVVPENTIEGFREGFALGGGVVECDVHASAEGTMVVIHDAVVDRTTDGAGPVAEKLCRNCRVWTPAITSAWMAVRPFRGELRASRFQHSRPSIKRFRTRLSTSRSRVAVRGLSRLCSAR